MCGIAGIYAYGAEAPPADRAALRESALDRGYRGWARHVYARAAVQ
jgi:hypothetical protein